MWTLSGGRIDPDLEYKLRWELPLYRALQYYHCALRASLQWTVPPGRPVKEVIAKTQAVHARAKAIDAELAEEVLA